MCGRFVRKAGEEEIGEEFEIEPEDFSFKLEPRYNIAPGQQAAAVFFDGKRRLAGLQWGLIPSWARDPKIGYQLINARAETLNDKPSFRQSFRKKRCLIVADGFYEWQRVGRGKVPVFIRLKQGKPFAFAGLYDDWSPPEGKAIRTFTIITTVANKLLAPIHDRMPAILPKEAYAAWLGEKTWPLEECSRMLGPYPEQEMEYWQVSPSVNSPQNDGPECIQPV